MIPTTPSISRHLLTSLFVLLASLLTSTGQLATQLLEEEQKVIASDGQRYQHGFGSAIAISNGMLAVTAISDDEAGENAGAVYLYRLDDSLGTWVFVQKIIPQPLPGRTDSAQFQFGNSLAMQGDTLLIGAPRHGNEEFLSSRTGAIYVYRRQGNHWIFNTKIIGTASRPVGHRLALAGDTLVSARSTGSFDPSFVAIFERDQGGSWNFVTNLNPNEEPGSGYGSAIAIDGEVIVVGDRTRRSGGVFAGGGAYVFERTNGVWNYAQTLQASDVGSFTNDQFGNGAAVRGNTIAIGTGGINRPYGRAVHVFRKRGGTWTEETILTSQLFGPPALRSRDQNYFPVYISEDERTIAAAMIEEYYDDPLDPHGAVLFFEERGQQWAGATRIGASGADSFGASLAIDGPYVAVGNLQEDLPETNEYDWFSSAYLFNANLKDAPESEVDAYLRAQLYYENALNESCCVPEDAAFRWKTLLYEGSGQDLHPAPDKIGDHFGETERIKAEEIRATVAGLLQNNPDSILFRDLLLDIDADLLGAEAIAARSRLVNIDRDRLLRVGVPPNNLILDMEVADYEAALPEMRAALADYLGLWTDDLGLGGGEEPLGYTIFKERAPERSLMPAKYVAEDDSLQPVGGSETALVNGYRDAVLLLDLFAEYGNTAASLAHLYWLQNTPASLQSARDLIAETSRFLFLQGHTLRGAFPGNPGILEEPLAAWNAALSALDQARANLNGTLNPLGFDDRFYVLFNVAQGGNDGLFDTFNILRERLDNRDSNFNQIVRATDAQQDAINAYRDFVGGQEELEDRLIDLTGDAKLRLLAIVGAPYGTSEYEAVPNEGPDNGYISGSELHQQYLNIERARLQIEKNGAEIENLRQAVAIEASRNAFEVETENAMAQIQIEYGDKRAEIEEEIGHINAAQAAADGIKDASQAENPVGVAGGLYAGVVNAVGEEMKGQLNAYRERLAAAEQAELIAKNNEILNANSAAAIKTMLLDMNVLVINSQENAILLQQELGRMTALFREKSALERRIQRHESNLSRRFFADPVHRLRYLNQYHIANQKFADAQQTIYFAARALEYKWNEPFADIMAATGYTLDTIYQVRNASELQLIVDAMEFRDSQLDTPANRPTELTDVFSLRADAFQFDSSPDGLEAFRDYLREHLSGDLETNSFVKLVLPFSTVRDPLRGFEGDNFFRGPRVEYSANGTASILQKGNYLDKIKTMQITIPGTHTLGPSSVSGSLVYGGTGFIRRKQPGDYNGDRPDRVADELVAFPTRVASNEAGIWSSADTLTATISIALGSTPGGSPIDQFRERSVATNGWVLEIVVKDGTQRLALEEIEDIKLHFTHQLLARQ